MTDTQEDDPSDDWSKGTSKLPPLDKRGVRPLDDDERQRSIERSKRNGDTSI
jgi:hypothetical protein